MRLRAGAEEFHKQIAALTIQLAWRKYIRRKLLKQIRPNRRQLRMWDPALIAIKQQALVKQIYGEEIKVPIWYPSLSRQHRPHWVKYIPSPAVLSFNFALDQYHPVIAKKGSMPSPLLDEKGHPRQFTWQLDEEELANQLNFIKLEKRPSQSRGFSYNLRNA